MAASDSAHKRPRVPVSVSVSSHFLPPAAPPPPAAAQSAPKAPDPATLHALILPLVSAFLRKHSALYRFREDLEQEAETSAWRASLRYRPEAGPLDRFLKRTVRLDIGKYARAMYASGVGGKVPDRGALDFGSPFYRPAVGSVSVNVVSVFACGGAGGIGAELAAARHKLMNRLRRLTLFEKEVVLRTCGIPRRPASRDAYARAAAEKVGPESAARIAQDYGMTGEEVEAVLAGALDRLGTLGLSGLVAD